MEEFPGENQAVAQSQTGIGAPRPRRGRGGHQEGIRFVDVQKEKETTGPGVLVVAAELELRGGEVRCSWRRSRGGRRRRDELRRAAFALRGFGGHGQQTRADGPREPQTPRVPAGDPPAEELLSGLGVLREAGGGPHRRDADGRGGAAA